MNLIGPEAPTRQVLRVSSDCHDVDDQRGQHRQRAGLAVAAWVGGGS
jgi:hypothetical protein